MRLIVKLPDGVLHCNGDSASSRYLFSSERRSRSGGDVHTKQAAEAKRPEISWDEHDGVRPGGTVDLSVHFGRQSRLERTTSSARQQAG